MSKVKRTDGENRGRNERYYPDYCIELFNIGFVIKGEVSHLEKIKMHIITSFATKRTLKFIKPTYSKNPLIITDYSHYSTGEIEDCRPLLDEGPCENEDFYFAFISRGEVKDLEKVKEIIRVHTDEGIIHSAATSYSKKKIFIIGKEI